MILFTNNQGEIKDVGTTKDESLIRHEISDDNNPFEGWSVAKICCYKVTVTDGVVTMLTPYKNSRWLDIVSRLGDGHEENADDIGDTRGAIIENYEDTADIRGAIIELYEMISEVTQ